MAEAKRRYNNALSYAYFILEGHNISETSKEFKVNRCTVRRNLYFLSSYGYGEEAEKNRILYNRVKILLYIRERKRRKNSGQKTGS